MGLLRLNRARRVGRRRGLLVGAATGMAVGAAMGRNRNQQAAAAQAQPESQENTGINADALEQLAQLHAAGILTDEEFEAKKKQVLNS